MFTWICPTCGREVAPHESECPHCASAAKGPTAEAGEAEAAAATPSTQPSAPPAGPPPGKAAAAATLPRPPGHKGIPHWLVGILAAVGIIAVLGAGLFYFLPSRRAERAAAAAPAASPLENPASAPAPGTVKQHPLARHLEITGLRLTEAGKKPQLQFLVVNHSGAELPPLELSIDLKTFNAAPGQEPISTLRVKVPGLEPYASKEMSAPLVTKLRAYELPDWQFLRTEFTLLAP